MALSSRVAVPVISAVIVVAIVGGILAWQLQTTRALLTQGINTITGSGSAIPAQGIANIPVDSGSESLDHLRRGDLLSLRGEWKLAAEEYQKAVDAGGGITALRKLAQAQLQRRDVRGAQNTLDQLRRAGMKSEDLLLLESIINLRTGELGKANTLLTAAADSPQKHYGLSLLAIVNSDHETAKKELALVSAGWEPILRNNAKILLGAYDEFALYADSNGQQIHLLALLAHSLAEVQECELALPLLSQATRQQDDYRDAWIVQGFCELTTERITESLASLERAYQLDPEKPEVQYFLGRAYIAMGDHGNALTFLQYALENGFEPEAEVRRLIAEQAIETGNVQLALDQEEALTKMQNTTIDAYIDYVAAAINAQKTQEAEVKAQEAVSKWPEDARAYDLLGWAQAVNGKKVEAKQNLDKALSLDPTLQSAKEHLKNL